MPLKSELNNKRNKKVFLQYANEVNTVLPELSDDEEYKQYLLNSSLRSKLKIEVSNLRERYGKARHDVFYQEKIARDMNDFADKVNEEKIQPWYDEKNPLKKMSEAEIKEAVDKFKKEELKLRTDYDIKVGALKLCEEKLDSFEQKNINKIKNGISGSLKIKMSDEHYCHYLYTNEIGNSSSEKDIKEFGVLRSKFSKKFSADFDLVVKAYLGVENYEKCIEMNIDPLALIRVDDMTIDKYIFDKEKIATRPKTTSGKEATLSDIYNNKDKTDYYSLLKADVMSALISGKHKVEIGSISFSKDNNQIDVTTASVSSMKTVSLMFDPDDKMDELERQWRDQNKKYLPGVKTTYIENAKELSKKETGLIDSTLNNAANILSINGYLKATCAQSPDIEEKNKKVYKQKMKTISQVNELVKNSENRYSLDDAIKGYGDYNWEVDDEELEEFFTRRNSFLKGKDNYSVNLALFYLDEYKKYSEMADESIKFKEVVHGLYSHYKHELDDIYSASNLYNMGLERDISSIRNTSLDKEKKDQVVYVGAHMVDLANQLVSQNIYLENVYKKTCEMKYGIYFDSQGNKKSIYEDAKNGKPLDLSVLSEDELREFKDLQKEIEDEIKKGKERADKIYLLSTKKLTGEKLSSKFENIMSDYSTSYGKELLQRYSNMLGQIIGRQEKQYFDVLRNEKKTRKLIGNYVKAQSMMDVIIEGMDIDKEAKDYLKPEDKKVFESIMKNNTERSKYKEEDRAAGIAAGLYTVRGIELQKRQNARRIYLNQELAGVKDDLREVKKLEGQIKESTDNYEKDYILNKIILLIDNDKIKEPKDALNSINGIGDYIPEYQNEEKKTLKVIMDDIEQKATTGLFEHLIKDVNEAVLQINENRDKNSKPISINTNVYNMEELKKVYQTLDEFSKDEIKERYINLGDVDSNLEDLNKKLEEINAKINNAEAELIKKLNENGKEKDKHMTIDSGILSASSQKILDEFIAKEEQRALQMDDWDEKKEAKYQAEIKDLKEQVRNVSNMTNQEVIDAFYAKEEQRALQMDDWDEEKEAKYQAEVKDLKDKVREIFGQIDEFDKKEEKIKEEYNEKIEKLRKEENELKEKISKSKNKKMELSKPGEIEQLQKYVKLEIETIDRTITEQKFNYFSEYARSLIDEKKLNIEKSLAKEKENKVTAKGEIETEIVSFKELLKEDDSKKIEKQKEITQKAIFDKEMDKISEHNYSDVHNQDIKKALLAIDKLQRNETKTASLKKRNTEAEKIFDSVKKYAKHTKIDLDYKEFKHKIVSEIKNELTLFDNHEQVNGLIKTKVSKNWGQELEKAYKEVQSFIKDYDMYISLVDKYNSMLNLKKKLMDEQVKLGNELDGTIKNEEENKQKINDYIQKRNEEEAKYNKLNKQKKLSSDDEFIRTVAAIQYNVANKLCDEGYKTSRLHSKQIESYQKAIDDNKKEIEECDKFIADFEKLKNKKYDYYVYENDKVIPKQSITLEQQIKNNDILYNKGEADYMKKVYESVRNDEISWMKNTLLKIDESEFEYAMNNGKIKEKGNGLNK